MTQGTSRRALMGSTLAAAVPIVVTGVILLRANTGDGDTCSLLVATPVLCLLMFVPTFIVGRAARTRWSCVLAMFATAAVTYVILGLSWNVWAHAADAVCR